MRSRSQTYRWFLITVILGAYALRIFRLDMQSLWWDEGISLNLATSTVSEILADRVVNIHPPLYFLILKIWIAMVGFTPFAARYSSVLVSLLQVPVVYVFTRRLFGGQAIPAAAAGLITLSPISILYGQELRVYVVLPLIYLVLMALSGRLISGDGSPKGTAVPGHSAQPDKIIPARSFWIGLGLVEWLGIHLHYTTIFAIVYVTLWASVVLIRHKRWLEFRLWWFTQLGVGFASLPWLTAIIFNWTAVQAEAQAGTFFAAPVPLDFLIKQVWVFHLTGLPGLLADANVRLLAGLAALGFLLLILARIRGQAFKKKALPLMGYWLIPLILAMMLWQLRSFSHPRYLTMFTIGLIPLAAYLLIPQISRKGNGRTLFHWVLSGIVGFVLIASSIFGLANYYFDPGVAKDDMRGAAHYLETAAGKDDLIIVPDAGWAFHFEYDGDTEIGMPALISREEMWRRLDEWTRRPRHIFTLMPEADSRDWQGVVAFALEKGGRLVQTKRFSGLVVREYEIDQPIREPILMPIAADFGAIKLVNVWIESPVNQNSAISLALNWRNDDPVMARYHVDVSLLDIDGWPLGHQSNMLVDSNGYPTDEWPPGQAVTTYHLLPVPPGTPPLTYQIALSMYTLGEGGMLEPVDVLDAAGSPQGQQFRLTDSLKLLPAVSGANPYDVQDPLPYLAQPVTDTSGLSLLAAGLDKGQVTVGQSIFASLRWEATNAPLPDIAPKLLLDQSGIVLAEAVAAPALGRYPTSLWQTEEQVLEHRRLQVPPQGENGLADVIIEFGEERLVIGQVEIDFAENNFEPPSMSTPLKIQFDNIAFLAGFDLPDTEFINGDDIPLTLYWQSLVNGREEAFTVFTHLLSADGRLIGQHDGQPVNGRRPLSGWVKGEYLIDTHLLRFRDTNYSGSAVIEVGFYDPATGDRLKTETGIDYVILPVQITILPGEQ